MPAGRMRPFSLHPLLTTSLLENDFQDLLLLSFLASMEDEEEEYQDGEDGSDEGEWDDDIEEEEDEGEEEEEEEEEESELEDSEDDEEDEDVEEPVPPKRRLLNNITPQETGAGSSSATAIANRAVLRSEPGNSSQSGSTSVRYLTRQLTVSLRRLPQALIPETQRPVQQQPVSQQNPQQPPQQRTNSASSQTSPSRSQQVQTDAPGNGAPRPLIRQVSEHDLPQARVVLRLSNDIGEMYPREE